MGDVPKGFWTNYSYIIIEEDDDGSEKFSEYVSEKEYLECIASTD